MERCSSCSIIKQYLPVFILHISNNQEVPIIPPHKRELFQIIMINFLSAQRRNSQFLTMSNEASLPNNNIPYLLGGILGGTPSGP